MGIDLPQNFRGVRAEGASFADADLGDVDLRGGRFTRADFTKANLAGADIEQKTSLYSYVVSSLKRNP